MAKITFQGRQVEATPVEIIRKSDDWDIYQLADGSELKVRTVVSEILKLDGVINADGKQAYAVISQTISAVT